MPWIEAPSGLITPHFSYGEMACRHCGRIPSIETVRKTAQWLEEVRHEVYEDRVMHITSGCRCAVHNKRIGGAPRSYHIRGMAVDTVVRGLSAFDAHRLARQYQGQGELIGGLGRYSGWVHLDRGPARTWNGP